MSGLPRDRWGAAVCLRLLERRQRPGRRLAVPTVPAHGAATLLHWAVSRPYRRRLRALIWLHAVLIAQSHSALLVLLPGHHQPLRPAAIHCHAQPGRPVPGDVSQETDSRAASASTRQLVGFVVGNGMAVALTPTIYGRLGWDALAVLWGALAALMPSRRSSVSRKTRLTPGSRANRPGGNRCASCWATAPS